MPAHSNSALLLFLVLSCAAPCFPGSTVDSIRSDVKTVLARFDKDSLRVTDLFGEDDYLHPGHPRDSGWGTLRKAWLYAPDLGSECKPIEDLRFDGDELYGHVIDKKTHIGDTTVVSGWDMASKERVSFSGFNVGILKSGDTAFGEAGGDAISGGSLGRVSRRALYFNGMNVYPIAEKEYCDTLVYEDPAGKRLACTRMASISIGWTNGFDYSSHSPPDRAKRSRTLHCATLPSQCRPDPGEAVLRELNERITGYRITLREDDSADCEALFRTRADCKRYAYRKSGAE